MRKYSTKKCRYCYHISVKKPGKSPYYWGNPEDFRACTCMESPCYGRLRCVGNQPRRFWDRACSKFEQRKHIDTESTAAS
jgi:hypothetical protein